MKCQKAVSKGDLVKLTIADSLTSSAERLIYTSESSRLDDPNY